MKKFTLLLLLAVLSFTMPASASHMIGGELRYEYTSTGNVYKIILVLYRNCGSNSFVFPPSQTVQISSSSCGLSIPLTVTSAGEDTLDRYMYCPSATTTCMSATAVYPGYVRSIYADTVTLPPCNDWKISYYNCCRNTLNSLVAGGLYLEAFLNNNAAINSCAYTPNPVPNMVSYNTLSTFPIPAVDPENDSVVTVFTVPQGLSTTGGNLGYVGGASLTQPFGPGSLSTINNANQTMTLKGTTVGYYALAMRINEYRNGQLVGYSTRDWQILLIASGPLTIPLAASSNPQVVTTCPGQSNTITLIYSDSTVTDSVYIEPELPAIPGFSFTVTGAPGVGSATSTISWTTPGTFNPATMPFFFINAFVHDTACDLRGSALYTVCVHAGQCAPDSVWPGDANGDFTVDMYDPLAIAIANGQTGPTRTGASTTWVAQACTPWSNSFLNGANMKHADCDGNGTVNNTDLGAVTTNYGLTHPKINIRNYAKTTGLPDLYFDAASVVFIPGQPVSIPIKLGTASSVANNVYGIATGIRVDGLTLAAAPAIAYPSSWIGNSGNTLSFTKATGNNATDWAYARTDHQNTSGQGTVATLNFTVPANAVSGQVFHIFFENTKLIDKNGTELTGYNILQDTSAVAISGGVGITNQIILQASIAPNPSSSNASLYLSTSRAATLSIRITDVTGRIVWQQSAPVSAGQSHIPLPAAVAAGSYTVQVQDEHTRESQVTKWTKQ